VSLTGGGTCAQPLVAQHFPRMAGGDTDTSWDYEIHGFVGHW